MNTTKPLNNKGVNNKSINKSTNSNLSTGNTPSISSVNNINNKSVNNQPVNNQPVNNQSSNNKSGNNQSGNNKSGNNQSGNNKSGNNKSGNNQSGNNKSSNNQYSNNKSGNNQTGNNKNTNNVNNKNTNNVNNKTTNNVNNKNNNKNNRNNKNIFGNSTPEKVNNTFSKNNKSILNTVSSKIKNTTSSTQSRLKDVFGLSEDTIMFILKAILAIMVLLALFYVGKYYFNKYTEMVYNSPYLLDSIKNAKRALVISQDPKNDSYIPISKSDGQDGIQFTYDFWILVETYDYKPGEWKHVFHKGNSSGYPNRAPGVWLHPSKNALRFYMNTQESILEYVDVDNIPARKWMHFSLIIDDKDMDIYVNGYLKTRKKLSSVPKQNNGDFWCNMLGGFEGFMSKIRYYSRAITPEEILSNVRNGPGDTNCLDGNDVPHYLDDNWWYDI
jgi:hypothetical protein